MIAYMPFTHISAAHLEWITAVLGPLTVYMPGSAPAPDHMRRFSDRGLLDLRVPGQLDADQLAGALEQFKQWADIHNGGIADMAAFFKSSAGRAPLVDPFSPTQITHQIRHFDEAENGRGPASLFRAALFLAIAQEYDRHQDELARDFGALDVMEKEMLAQLSGKTAEPSGGLARARNLRPVGNTHEPGLYMTDSRIRAWAELAIKDDQPPQLLLTTSPAVWDHLTDLFADAVPMGSWDLGGESDAVDAARNRRDVLAAIASAARPDAGSLSRCMKPADIKCFFRLTLITLAGCPPQAAMRRLLSKNNSRVPGADGDPEAGNTLIGLVDTCRD